MSNSNSSLPAIIVAAAVIIMLVIFYVADRSSPKTDLSAVTETADTEKMISSKAKYEKDKEVFSHSGYSGDLDSYLKQNSDSNEPDESVAEHSGYTGSGDDYVAKYQAEEDKHQRANSGDHAGFSGTLDDYLDGNYEKRAAKSSSSKQASASSESSSSSGHSDSHEGFDGSVHQYMKKFGG